MQQRPLGNALVGAIGLGAMPMSVREHNDTERGIRTIHRALDEGVTLIDTADAYSPDEASFGHSEELVARALRTYGGGTDQVVVATKGGHTRRGTGWELDGSPAYLRRACEASLRRLGVEAIGLYQHHRPDPSVPYDETLHGLLGLLDAGLALRVGISNADASQIERACEVIGDGFVSVQNQFSPVFRSSADELALCERLGLAFLPWSPLGGMGGMSSAAEAGTAVTVFGEVAEKHQVSAQQVCLAWELAQSPVVIPIPGASRPESVADSVRAVDLVLDQDDMDRLNRA